MSSAFYSPVASTPIRSQSRQSAVRWRPRSADGARSVRPESARSTRSRPDRPAPLCRPPPSSGRSRPRRSLFPTNSARPTRSAQYGAKVQCADPVAGSSGMPTAGAKTRLTQSIPGRSPAAVTMTQRTADCGDGRQVRLDRPDRPGVGQLDEEVGPPPPAPGTIPSIPSDPGGSDGGRRVGREVHLDPPVVPRRAREEATAGDETARTPEHVGRGQGGVPAQVDLDRRGEPAQVVRPVGASRRRRPSPRGSSRGRSLHPASSGKWSTTATAAGLPAKGRSVKESTTVRSIGIPRLYAARGRDLTGR